MTLHEYVMTLKRHWVLIVALIVVGGAGGLLYTKMQVPLYRSTSGVLLSADRGNSTSDLVQGSSYVQNLVQSYTVLAVSDVVLQPVVDELGLDRSASQLSHVVSADAPLNTVVIELSVSDPDPREAQRIATAVTSSLSTAVAKVSPHEDGGAPSVRLTTINSATLPTVQFWPDSRLGIGIGAFLGLVLGIGIAFLRRALSTRLTDADDVAATTSEPLLGEIVETKRNTSIAASILLNPRGIVMESFRHLAANLRFADIDRKIKTLVVSSAQSGEGKSSTAIGLAIALAESGQRVLLMDADLRHPSIGKYTQLEGAVGLTSVLVGELELDRAVQGWGHPSLDVLTSGEVPPNPNQLLTSLAMSTTLQEARAAYDVVVVDSAPVISVTDALWLGNMSDGVILVARERFTRRRHLERAILSVQAAHAELAGVVLNGVKRAGHESKYYVSEQESKLIRRRELSESGAV